MADLEREVREYEKLKTERFNFDNQWQLIADLLVPHMSNITVRRAVGQTQTDQLYDSTGIDALDKLIAALAGTLTNPAVQWFTLRMRDEALNDTVEVAQWLDDSAKRMFIAFNQSNFRSASVELYADLAAFGTGAMSVMERAPGPGERRRDFHGFQFNTVPIGTYVIGENADGRVNQFMREFTLSLRATTERWPDAEYPPDVVKALEKDPHQRITIIHSIRPTGRSRMPWDNIFYSTGNTISKSVGTSNLTNLNTLGGVGGKAFLIAESQLNEFPMLVPRWSKTAGETFGRGRGHLALPEVRTLNRARQLKLRQWALAVNPPLQALDDGVVGKARIIPGALNIVRQLGTIAPIDIGQRFDHTAIPEQESKLQIRQIFFTEQLLQFAAAGKTPPTATEIVTRMEFLHQLLGPAVGRIQDEGLSPMIDRAFNIMFRAGQFSEPPPILLEQGGDIDIEFEGPLARSQRSDELKSLNDYLIFGQQIGTFDPAAIDTMNADAMMKDLPRLVGAAAKYSRSDEEVEQIRAEREQQQQAAIEAQQAQQGSETARNLGQAAQSAAQAEQAVA